MAADLRNLGDAAQIGKKNLYSRAYRIESRWNIAFNLKNPVVQILQSVR